MSSFQNFDHKLIFVILIRYINTKLLKSCSKNQKLLEVAKFGRSCSKRQKLLKSCRAQSVRAYNVQYTRTDPTVNRQFSWPIVIITAKDCVLRLCPVASDLEKSPSLFWGVGIKPDRLWHVVWDLGTKPDRCWTIATCRLGLRKITELANTLSWLLENESYSRPGTVRERLWPSESHRVYWTRLCVVDGHQLSIDRAWTTVLNLWNHGGSNIHFHLPVLLAAHSPF